jgi:quinol monooxygenase YgiN
MIVCRYELRCRPERAEEMVAALEAVARPSRELPGVVHFDVARSLTDPDTLVVLEVFENREALARQEEQPQVAAVLALVEAGAVTDEPAWTVWETTPDQGRS